MKKGKDSVIETSGGAQFGFANDTVNLNAKFESEVNKTKLRADVAAVVQAPTNLYWAGSVKYIHHVQSDDQKEAGKEWDYNLKLHYAQPTSSVTVN